MGEPATPLTDHAEVPALTDAARVADLEAQILELRRSRDEVRGELATAKATLSAHLLSCPFQFTPAQEEVTAYLRHGGPLRYRVVDALNDGIKDRLPGVHQGFKNSASFLTRKLRRPGD
jgi:hypothetical protein